MKNRLIRPSAALFPLSMLVACGLECADTVYMLLLFYFALQIFSLCAVDCYRNAAAREPSPRKADRRFWASAVMLALSPILLGCLSLACGGEIGGANLRFYLAPWLILIEQLFEERLYTLGRRFDGNLLALLANGLLFAGILLDGENGAMLYTTVMAGAGALVAALASLVIAPPKGFALLPINLGFAPKAAVQCLLFPAAAFALMQLQYDFTPFSLFLLPGYGLWRLSRTTCRRSADESRAMNLILCVCAAASLLADCFVSEMKIMALGCILSLLCALIVFLRSSIRNLSAAALLILALVLREREIAHCTVIVAALCLCAVAINLKHAFLKKV